MRTGKKEFVILAVLAAFAAGGAEAGAQLREVFSESASKTLPLEAGGVVFVESFAGSILVTGGDDDKVVVEATRVIKATEGTDVRQIRAGLGVRFEGTPVRQTIRSVGIVNSRQLASRIDYHIKVPRSASVNLIAGIGESFTVEGLRGRVYVRNVSGRISIDKVTGPVFVDSVNADVIVVHRSPPISGSELKSTNGSVEIRVPEKSKLRWVAKTLNGDIMTGGLKSLAGRLIDAGGQKTYSAVLNGTDGPQLNAFSLTGRLYLLPTEKPRTLAASVLPKKREPDHEDLGHDFRQIVTSLLIRPPTARTFYIQKGRQEGNLDVTAHLGSNIFYAEIEGNATVTSHGGEVVLGRVGGKCTIESKGGGVNLGHVMGPVNASTAAGDVLVRVAHQGGRVSTGGGNIHVLFAGGEMTLDSGGGDVTVRQAAGGLQARTDSGDVVVATDPKPSDGPISLITERGNVVFEISPSRGYDIDAEIEVSQTSANRIESVFSGLTTVREKVGNRVKIRARGQINGGGTPVTLRARDGNIVIGSVPENRIVLVQ
jgi:DUF4097 and DUF4098 domain-containing protein YvlB